MVKHKKPILTTDYTKTIDNFTLAELKLIDYDSNETQNMYPNRSYKEVIEEINNCKDEKYTFMPWFDINLSKILNIPIEGTFHLSDKIIGLGMPEYEKKYCKFYEYNNKTDLFGFDPYEQQPISERSELLNKLKSKLSKETNIIRKKALQTRYEKILGNLFKPIKTITVGIYPDKKQEIILQNWMKDCINIRNKCIELYRNDDTFFNRDYKQSKLDVFKEFNKIGVLDENGILDLSEFCYDNEKIDNKESNNEIPKKKNKINRKEANLTPYDILTDEVRRFTSDCKSASTNLKNGNIKHFTMKFTNIKNKNRHSIFIPKTAIKQNSIYGRYLGKMKGLEYMEFFDIECDARIIYIKNKNIYQLKIPVFVDTKEVKNRENIVGIDMGVNIPVAFHGENSFGKFGHELTNDLVEIRKKISTLQSRLDKNRNRKKRKIKNKKALKNKIQRLYDKMTNLVTEFRNKTSLFLVKNYSRIILPVFNSQQMMKPKKYTKKFFNDLEKKEGNDEMKNTLRTITKTRRLNRRTKFVLNMLSPYKFRQHLIRKGYEYNCEIYNDATEEFTTKSCTNCGHMSYHFNGRTKMCSNCDFKCNRDVSSARVDIIKHSWENMVPYDTTVKSRQIKMLL